MRRPGSPSSAAISSSSSPTGRGVQLGRAVQCHGGALRVELLHPSSPKAKIDLGLWFWIRTGSFRTKTGIRPPPCRVSGAIKPARDNAVPPAFRFSISGTWRAAGIILLVRLCRRNDPTLDFGICPSCPRCVSHVLRLTAEAIPPQVFCGLEWPHRSLFADSQGLLHGESRLHMHRVRIGTLTTPHCY
jgi:hypothetical protein